MFSLQALEEVELVPPELADEDVRLLPMWALKSFRMDGMRSEAPDAETFDLEKELEQRLGRKCEHLLGLARLIGLKEIKESIRHTRNFIEVQSKTQRRDVNEFQHGVTCLKNIALRQILAILCFCHAIFK